MALYNQPNIPFIKSWNTGDHINAADLNTQIRDSVAFLTAHKPHAGMFAQNVQTTVPNNAWTTIQLDTVTVDTHGSFSSNGLYTAMVSGWYQVMAGVVFTADTSFDRAIRFFYDNGAAFCGIASCKSTGITTGVTLNRMIPLVAGQTMALQGWHNAGHNVNTENVNGAERSWMDVAFFSQFFGYTI